MGVDPRRDHSFRLPDTASDPDHYGAALAAARRGEPVADAELHQRIEAELGDVLFVIANIARRWQVNPEEALRKSNSKFERRFRFIEDRLRENGRDIRDASIVEMEELYQAGKRIENAEQPGG